MKKPKVTFWLKQNGEKDKNKPALIMLNCSYGKRMRMSTELSIKPANWDSGKQLPKTSFADYSNYKAEFTTLESWIFEAFDHFAKQGKIPEPETLKRYVQDKKQGLKFESDFKTLHNYYEEFLEVKKPEIKLITYKKYVTLQNVLKEFEAKYNCTLSFENMDLEFGSKFKLFLNNVKGNNNNAASKTIDCLKVFMKWAFKKGYHKEFYYSEFSSKRDKTEVIYLNLAELRKLLNLKLEAGSKLERTRDWFCFQCLTGQRFSDIEALKWLHLTEREGVLIWSLYQKKGNKTDMVTIPILKPALEILKRQDRNRDTVFNNISNQKLNKNIKELCKLAGLNEYIPKIVYRGKKADDKSAPKHEHVTSHTGRKSFVNIAYYDLLMDKETIRAITGHTTDKMLNVYIGKDKKHVFKEMAKWNHI